MGFGRNQYVAKAQAAEEKARDAADEPARVRAWHEAAHEWDREFSPLAALETPGSRARASDHS